MLEKKHKYSTLSIRRLGVHLPPPADQLVRVRAVRATVVVVAATTDVSANIAATRGDREGPGGGTSSFSRPPHLPTSTRLSSIGEGWRGRFLDDALPPTTTATSRGGRPPTPPTATSSSSSSMSESGNEDAPRCASADGAVAAAPSVSPAPFVAAAASVAAATAVAAIASAAMTPLLLLCSRRFCHCLLCCRCSRCLCCRLYLCRRSVSRFPPPQCHATAGATAASDAATTATMPPLLLSPSDTALPLACC